MKIIISIFFLTIFNCAFTEDIFTVTSFPVRNFHVKPIIHNPGDPDCEKGFIDSLNMENTILFYIVKHDEILKLAIMGNIGDYDVDSVVLSYNIDITSPSICLYCGYGEHNQAQREIKLIFDVYQSMSGALINIEGVSELTIVSSELDIQYAFVSYENGDLHITKVGNSINIEREIFSIDICSGKSCDFCMTNDRCGWCYESDSCMLGSSAGPLYGNCKSWVYSQTSGRINIETESNAIYPLHQDIYLSDSKISLELILDIGNQNSDQPFDISFFSPAVKNNEVFEFFSQNNYVEGLMSEKVRISYSGYDNDGIVLSTDLLNSYSTYLEKFETFTPNEGDSSIEIGDIISELETLSFTSNSRRVAIIFLCDSCILSDVDIFRESLLKKNVFPILLTTTSNYELYTIYVSELEFGYAAIYQSYSINEAIENALAYVYRNVPKFYTKPTNIFSEQIHEFYMYGIENLERDVKVRIVLPLDDDSTGQFSIIFPGIGRSQINYLTTVLPKGKSEVISIKQNDVISENNKIRGAIITLKASSPLTTTFQYEFIEITKGDSLIDVGEVYKYPDDITSITSIQDLDPITTTSTIDNGKLIYIPTEEPIDKENNDDNYVKITLKAFDSCLKSESFSLTIFIEPDCKEGICIIDNEYFIDETIIVRDYLKITKKAIIRVDRRTKMAIINDNDEPVNIEGGIIIFEIEDEEDYEFISEQTKKNGSYEYIIIKGKYDGSFDDLKLQLSSEVEEKCEKIEGEFKEEDSKMSIVFSINYSDCNSFKWWYILLICLGCIMLLAAIFAILVIKNKELRNKILPFRRRAEKV